MPSGPVTEPSPGPFPPLQEQVEKPEEPSPRALASLRLTERARRLLAMNQPDEAIRTLERALNLNPDDGKNYYYLAEAWIKKGKRDQAAEFNRVAGIYLQDDAAWLRMVERQRERIEDSF